MTDEEWAAFKAKIAGHTKGPWRVREGAKNTPEDADYVICGDIWQLADINGPQYSHQNRNAALIAAAPSLVAEVERLRGALNSIDALDPERGAIHGMSESAVKGLVLRMGEIARTALTGSSQ